MNRGINIIVNQLLVDEYGVLVVVAFPCHEADEGVLAECDLAHLCCGAVSDNVASLYTLALAYDRALIYAVALVGALELDKSVDTLLTEVVCNNDLVCVNLCNYTVLLGAYNYAGVYRSLVLHTGADDRIVGNHKRNRLTLHVRAHQSTVRVVVLEERDHSRSDGNDHLRRYVHEVDLLALDFKNGVAAACVYAGSGESAFLVEGLVRLSYNVVILNVGGHVNDLVENLAGSLVNASVGSLDEAVNVDPCESSKVGDQTDVRTFRGLDRAHSSVVGVVYVTNLESGSVSGQTARTKGGQTALVGKLSQRVVLIHELRQRRGSEELSHRGNNLTAVNEGVGSYLLLILTGKRHLLANGSLHTCEAYAELVLEQLAYAADTSVAEVVDIVHVSDVLAEVDEVAYGREYIFNCDVLGDKLLCARLDEDTQGVLVACCFLEDIAEDSEAHVLVDAEGLNIHIAGVGLDVDHAVAAYLYGSALACGVNDGNVDNAGILDLESLLLCDYLALVDKDLTGQRRDDCLGSLLAVDTLGNSELLIILIAAESGEVVSLGVEEQHVELILRGLHGSHVAGVELLVDLEKSLFLVLGAVLLDGAGDSGVVAELSGQLCIGGKTDGAEEGGNGDLSVLINAYIEHVVGVHLVLEPCAAVRDNSRLEQLLTGLVVLKTVVNAR